MKQASLGLKWPFWELPNCGLSVLPCAFLLTDQTCVCAPLCSQRPRHVADGSSNTTMPRHFNIHGFPCTVPSLPLVFMFIASCPTLLPQSSLTLLSVQSVHLFNVVFFQCHVFSNVLSNHNNIQMNNLEVQGQTLSVARATINSFKKPDDYRGGGGYRGGYGHGYGGGYGGGGSDYHTRDSRDRDSRGGGGSGGPDRDRDRGGYGSSSGRHSSGGRYEGEAGCVWDVMCAWSARMCVVCPCMPGLLLCVAQRCSMLGCLPCACAATRLALLCCVVPCHAVL